MNKVLYALLVISVLSLSACGTVPTSSRPASPDAAPTASPAPESGPQYIRSLLEGCGADPDACTFELGYTTWLLEGCTVYSAPQLSGGTALVVQWADGAVHCVTCAQSQITDLRTTGTPGQLELFCDGRLLCGDFEVRHFEGSCLVDTAANAIISENYTAVCPAGLYGTLARRQPEEHYLLSRWQAAESQLSLEFDPALPDMGWPGPAFYFFPAEGDSGDEHITTRLLLSRVQAPDAAALTAALEQLPGVEQAVIAPAAGTAAQGALLEITVNQRDGWKLRFGLSGPGTAWPVQQLTIWCENRQGPFPLAAAEGIYDTLDFMSDEQRTLYQQAQLAAPWLFGLHGNLGYTGENDSVQPADAPPQYYRYNVAYSRFLDRRVLPVFTKDFLLRIDFGQKYKQYDGDLLAHSSLSRPLPYGCTRQVQEAYPDRYRVITNQPDCLEFMLIAHYDRSSQSQADMDVFTVEYPIRMVNTPDGWRLDEFHTAYHG